jgi:hypothetical protein
MSWTTLEGMVCARITICCDDTSTQVKDTTQHIGITLPISVLDAIQTQVAEVIKQFDGFNGWTCHISNTAANLLVADRECSP